MTKFPQLDRRNAMKLLLAAGAASGVASCGNGSETKSAPRKVSKTMLDTAEMALLTALSSVIIPTTETLGAADVGVPDTIQDLLKNWGEDDLRVYWFEGLASIETHFKKTKGKPFASLDPVTRLSALETYDKAVYEGKIDNPFYKNAKATIARAYYMTEVGADEELIYDPVPGDFQGCIPFEDVGRAWAT